MPTENDVVNAYQRYRAIQSVAGAADATMAQFAIPPSDLVDAFNAAHFNLSIPDTDAAVIHKQRNELLAHFNELKKGAKKDPSHSRPMNHAILEVKLPGKRQISVEDLDTAFKEVVDRCRETIGDPKLTQENFGAAKYFFFVNRSTGTLIDDSLFFIDAFTLQKMGAQPGQIWELCYVP